MSRQLNSIRRNSKFTRTRQNKKIDVNTTSWRNRRHLWALLLCYRYQMGFLFCLEATFWDMESMPVILLLLRKCNETLPQKTYDYTRLCVTKFPKTSNFNGSKYRKQCPVHWVSIPIWIDCFSIDVSFLFLFYFKVMFK